MERDKKAMPVTPETVLEVDKRELEYQYSPSMWSKRMGAQAVISSHVVFVGAESKKARESVPYEVLHYGESENQMIDLYGTSLPNDSPLLVYIHGGYWQDLDRSISAYLVKPLFNKGIRVAIVGYDLAPKVTLANIVEEMEQLDKFLTSWSVKTGTKCIWYSGHSAGAYLIGAILKKRGDNDWLTSDHSIRGLIFISGIYDLSPLVCTYINNNLNLTGVEAKDRSLTEIEAGRLNRLTFLIVVAEHDSPEFHRQSNEFYKMLRRQCPTAEYMVIKDTDHFDVVEKLNDEHYELTQKIVKLILGKESTESM